MTNILVLGVGPLPIDPVDRLFAPGLRTWHFCDLLARRRHRVVAAVIDFGDSGGGAAPAMPRREEAGENITVIRLGYDPPRNREALATLIRSGRLEAVVSTTDVMNDLAVTLPGHLPTWLDYNGDPFAEKQLMGVANGNDATLFNQWRMLLPGLLGGDRFSTCSTAQKYALLGQLALAGRLNEHTVGETLVEAITPCSRAMSTGQIGAPYSVKGRLIPNDCFMALWTGGYNTWSDPETLFGGLTKAMQADTGIFYVSTGGGIEGHETGAFARFENMVTGSGMETRFRLLGWVPTESIPSIYRQADVAINLDRPCYEGELGHRNRLVDWILHKVPIVTTVLCELSQHLAAQGLVWPVEMGNPDSLAEALLAAKGDPAEAKRRAEAAQAYFNTRYREEDVFASFMSWAERPAFAGDRAGGAEVGGLGLWQQQMLAEHGAGTRHGRMGGWLKRLAARIRRTK